MNLFVEEMVLNYQKTGKVSSSFQKDKVKELVFLSMKNTNRFNGLTKEPYSLLKHSYFVGKLAWNLAKIKRSSTESDLERIVEICIHSMVMGFCHDMGESIIGDIVYPIKHNFMGENYNKLACFEQAVLEYLWNDVFEFGNYKEIREETIAYVWEADSIISDLELIGFSEISDFKLVPCCKGFFDAESVEYEDCIKSVFRDYKEVMEKKKNEQ